MGRRQEWRRPWLHGWWLFNAGRPLPVSRSVRWRGSPWTLSSNLAAGGALIGPEPNGSFVVGWRWGGALVTHSCVHCRLPSVRMCRPYPTAATTTTTTTTATTTTNQQQTQACCWWRPRLLDSAHSLFCKANCVLPRYGLASSNARAMAHAPAYGDVFDWRRPAGGANPARPI
jgi:hypothetical protein